MPRKARDTYKYNFRRGDGSIEHRGITNDLERREAEHRRRTADLAGSIEQVGRRTTRGAAEVWERRQCIPPFDRACEAVEPPRKRPKAERAVSGRFPRGSSNFSFSEVVGSALAVFAVTGAVITGVAVLSDLLGGSRPPGGASPGS